MQQVLSTDSNLIFVWHDNCGQQFPDNSKELQTKINANGFSIEIADNANITMPLVIITSAAMQNTAHITINLGKNAKAQIVEYLMCDDTSANNNITTTIYCNDNSVLQHCVLQHAKQSAKITQKSITHIKQSQDSTVNSSIFAFGNTASSIELAIALQGKNAKCETSCLTYLSNTEVQNVLLQVDHLVPHCTSKSIARGILKDAANSDFIGRIIVHTDASKSLADLQIKNILCSDKAQATNKPELEIYNGDVQCSHGSSTGQINEEALFYMRSRGLDVTTANAMLIKGFIQPVITACNIPGITAFVSSLITEISDGI